MKHIRFLRTLVLILCVLMLASCGEPDVSTADTTESEPDTSAPETTAPSTTETTPETKPDVPKKRVAITFDDGPSRQGLTYKIVDEFAKYNGKATFFVLGNLMSKSTGEAMSYAHERGFEIGIHAYTHELYFNKCTESEFLDEVRMTKDAIQKYVDTDVTLLRAPGGALPRERAILAGYPVINWSIDSEDWRYKSRADDATIQKNVDTIVANALRDVRDGDIILMHEIYTNSYEATCRILRELDAMGFEFVTVTELIGKENLHPGATYYSRDEVR